MEDQTTRTRAQALARLRDEAKGSPPEECKPDRLPISALHLEPLVFQPRARVSEAHVKCLEAAIRARNGEPLEAVRVWHSGTRWYVVDGHHRLEAYRSFNAVNPQLRITLIPVRAFEGTLAEAICESTKGNSRDKLPMRQEDKSNAAWRIVCLGERRRKPTATDVARIAGVSKRTVDYMRKVRGKLLRSGDEEFSLENLENMTWNQARSAAAGEEPRAWDEDAIYQQGVEWADRLSRLFGAKFASNPESAAIALQVYSGDLPRRMLETDVFQDALEAYQSGQEDEPEGGYY